MYGGIYSHLYGPFVSEIKIIHESRDGVRLKENNDKKKKKSELRQQQKNKGK